MQKKNNKGVIALIIVLVLAAAALVIWQTNKRETQQGGKEITINVDHLNGDDTTFTIHTDEEYLRGALEQEDLIEGTESEYGLYVLTVDGETADESAVVGLQRERHVCRTRRGQPARRGRRCVRLCAECRLVSPQDSASARSRSCRFSAR